MHTIILRVKIVHKSSQQIHQFRLNWKENISEVRSVKNFQKSILISAYVHTYAIQRYIINLKNFQFPVNLNGKN